jgi:hypothetical protein
MSSTDQKQSVTDGLHDHQFYEMPTSREVNATGQVLPHMDLAAIRDVLQLPRSLPRCGQSESSNSVDIHSPITRSGNVIQDGVDVGNDLQSLARELEFDYPDEGLEEFTDIVDGIIDLNAPMDYELESVDFEAHFTDSKNMESLAITLLDLREKEMTLIKDSVSLPLIVESAKESRSFSVKGITGDDLCSAGNNTLHLSKSVSLIAGIMRLIVDETATYISRYLGYCSEFQMIPRSTFGSREGAKYHKNKRPDLLDWFDRPNVQTAVFTSDQPGAFKDVRTGKACLSRHGTGDIVNIYDAPLCHMTSLIQDGSVRTVKASMPKYLSNVAGGCGLKPLFGVKMNSALYLLNYRGGSQRVLLGSQLAELIHAVESAERGLPCGTPLNSAIRTSVSVFGRDKKVIITSGDNGGPVKAWDGKGEKDVYPLISKSESVVLDSWMTRLEASKRIVPRSVAVRLVEYQRDIRNVMMNMETEKSTKDVFDALKIQQEELAQEQSNRPIYKDARIQIREDLESALPDVGGKVTVTLPNCAKIDIYARVNYSIDLYLKWRKVIEEAKVAKETDLISIREDLFLVDELNTDQNLRVRGLTLFPWIVDQIPIPRKRKRKRKMPEGMHIFTDCNDRGYFRKYAVRPWKPRKRLTISKPGTWYFQGTIADDIEKMLLELKELRDKKCEAGNISKMFGLPPRLFEPVMCRFNKWVTDDVIILDRIQKRLKVVKINKLSSLLIYLMSDDQELARMIVTNFKIHVIVISPTVVCALWGHQWLDLFLVPEDGEVQFHRQVKRMIPYLDGLNFQHQWLYIDTGSLQKAQERLWKHQHAFSWIERPLKSVVNPSCGYRSETYRLDPPTIARWLANRDDPAKDKIQIYHRLYRPEDYARHKKRRSFQENRRHLFMTDKTTWTMKPYEEESGNRRTSKPGLQRFNATLVRLLTDRSVPGQIQRVRNSLLVGSYEKTINVARAIHSISQKRKWRKKAPPINLNLESFPDPPWFRNMRYIHKDYNPQTHKEWSGRPKNNLKQQPQQYP